ncbi:MAG: choice-of-anchor B family protein [Bacteroidia bacterium]|nr:choice-of-anchor B family protein [Bacteroidia bacterium]
MKKIILFIFLINLVQTKILALHSFRIRKLDSYNNPNLPKVDATDIWNDLTGYVDPITQKEYIICGSTDSVYFFDISTYDKMKLVDVKFGASFFARNRDFETYSHYAYCVADQASGIGALQIFDLQYLPDSVHLVYQSNEFGTFTHTIFIDSISARLYMCSNSKPSGFSAMDVLSLENPEAPTYLMKLQVPTKSNGFPLFNKVHEMYARGDTAYLSCEEAGLFIFDMRTTGSNPLLGTINSYPDQGYNHSSWLDKTGRYLMFTDENMGMDIKIFDIQNINSPQFVSQFNSNVSTTPHNAFWYGDFAYVSAYHDGLRIYDIKDPSNPQQVGWYDTHPVVPETYGGYKGCWGVYPYLPSRRIIASDSTSGIFLLEIDSALVGNKEITKENSNISIFPNPGNDEMLISFDNHNSKLIKVYDSLGRKVIEIESASSLEKIETSNWPTGIYFVEINLGQTKWTKKWVK